MRRRDYPQADNEMSLNNVHCQSFKIWFESLVEQSMFCLGLAHQKARFMENSRIKNGKKQEDEVVDEIELEQEVVVTS